jgi:hypothetical protein
MTDNAARNKKAVVEALTDAYAKRDFAKLEKWFAPASTILSFRPAATTCASATIRP